MSHHFSPEFTVLPPGKEPVSKKLQRTNEQTSSARQRETQKLDFDNKQMEWKLNQLKQAMSKEKEDRGKQASIWKSGNSKIESHSRNILGKTVSATVNGTRRVSPKSGSKSAPKSKQPGRVKILRDEPLDLPQRDSRTKDLIRKLQDDKPPAEEPVQKTASVLPRRHEYWINFAIDRNSEDVFELQSDLDGNLPLSAVQAMEPNAVGIFFVKWGRKRLLIAANGAIRKPKTGWGDEVYFPYIAKSLPEMAMKPEPPLRNVSNMLMRSPEPKGKHIQGGLLLQGSFDEEKNAEAFQKALNEWRHGKAEKTLENRTRKATPEMSVHVAQCTPEPFEVKFSETSTLSYMEQVLLQKHRTSQVPPLPKSLSETLNDRLGNDMIGDNEKDVILTEEEEEERQRYRELFSPEPANSMEHSSAKVLSIAEIDQDEGMDTTDHCFVEESPPVSPAPSIAKSNQTVIIKEISYDVTKSESRFQPMQTEDSKKGSATYDKENITTNSLNLRGKNDSDQKMKKNSHPARKIHSKSAKSKAHSARSVKRSMKEKPRSKTAMSHDLEVSVNSGGISHNVSLLVHEISKIPINPDAIYHKGLNEFFSEKNASPQNHNSPKYSLQISPPLESEIAKNSGSWNPLSSVLNDNVLSQNITPAADIRKKQSPAEESEQYDTKSLTDNESADERALDDLEWELASRTGNLTADGRISRLIDEWPQEDDLEIIDDPGDGSGLSTPDVRSNSISKVSVTDPNDPQLQYDFRNMERMMMADVSDEYSEEET